MKITRKEKGITLVALIITIIVLLILAVVSIRAVTGDGIIQYAKNAKSEYELAQANEDTTLESYIGFLESEKSATTIEEATEAVMLQKTVNSTVYDVYGNKVVVPAGFKIRIDDTTNNADTVTEGIVIEDAKGNQFVWIPVGKIYTDTAKTETNAKTITLGRYSWSGSTGTLVQPTVENLYTSEIEIMGQDGHNYIEYQPISTTENSKARNINDFYESATKNRGYYLGRYEAGDGGSTSIESRVGTNGTSTEGTLVCKANQVPYNWIMQADALNECQSMYPDGYSNGTFSSDLVNSYAWDTAIIFIQTFGRKNNSSAYASTIGYSKTSTSELQKTGTNILDTTGTVDEQLNIYDMAGNCREWTTETAGNNGQPCSSRGGFFNSNSVVTSYRGNTQLTTSNGRRAFRTLLYVSL